MSFTGVHTIINKVWRPLNITIMKFYILILFFAASCYDAKDTKCDMCQKMVTELEMKYIPQLSEQQFIDYLVNNVCAKLDGDFKTMCVTLVHQYGHEIYTDIGQLLNPNIICKSFRLCSSTAYRSSIVASSETCKICKEVFGFLENIINSVTPNELETLLKDFLCTQLPSDIQTVCNDLVDGFTNQIYQLLKSLLDGNRVCPAVHLCSNNLKVNSVECELCQYIITETRSIIADTTVQNRVENFLKQEICSHFGQKQEECVSIINNYFTLVINLVLEAWTPSICSDMHLCAAGKSQFNQNPLLSLLRARKLYGNRNFKNL